MGHPISVRLEDDVRDELEAQARSRGIGLATLLRDLATEAAWQARRVRIRDASAAIGRHVAASVEGQALYEEWGTPRTDVGQ
jgi:predicted DNA-binding ribbon-helix-helix protein